MISKSIQKRGIVRDVGNALAVLRLKKMFFKPPRHKATTECHGFRLTKQDDFFESILTTFKSSIII